MPTVGYVLLQSVSEQPHADIPELLDLCKSEVDAEDALDVTTRFWEVVGLLTVGKLLQGIGGVLQPTVSGRDDIEEVGD